METVSSFHPHLLRARATALHFLLRRGLVILQPAVAQAKVKPRWPADFPRLVTEKGSRLAVAAASFVARSLLGIGRSFSVGLSGSQTWLGIAGLGIPFDLFAAADPALAAAAAVVVGPAAAAVVVVAVAAAAGPAVSVGSAVFADLASAVGSDFAVAADLACSVDFACSFGAGMGKGRAVVAISCFLTPRSFF